MCIFYVSLPFYVSWIHTGYNVLFNCKLPSKSTALMKYYIMYVGTRLSNLMGNDNFRDFISANWLLL